MADQKLKQLEEQLKRIGCNYQLWGRSEVRELAHLLWDNEIVEHCINGFYDGGFAMLAATNQRVVIIDKKPFYLNLEDIRFDMISEIDFNHRLLDASVYICTPNKNLRFTAFNQDRARKVYHFIQTRVMEVRERYTHPVVAPQYIAIGQGGQPQAQQAFIAPPFSSQEWLGYAAQLQQQSQIQPGQTPLVTQPHHMQLPHIAPRVAPIISAYSRLPMRSRQRRFLGSRALI